MTGILPVVPCDGLTRIPGSTLGGVIVPFCSDNRSLRSPAEGAIFSAGAEGPLGGATGTVGLACGVVGAFCASTGAEAKTRTSAVKIRLLMVRESVRGIILSLSTFPPAVSIGIVGAAVKHDNNDATN